MDNPLTPNKIQILMHLAEDKSFNVPRRLILNDEDVKRFASAQVAINKSCTNTNYESSGVLDLERIEGFGESGISNITMSKSTVFNPGEMTGRSTGTDDIEIQQTSAQLTHGDEYGRHSLALDSLQSHMDKQTLEVNDIMRHSIATNYSFHSKRDLTADEASLVMREAPLPVTHNMQLNFQDSLSMDQSNMSVGAYFKNKCPEFGRILGKTDSPDRGMRPSITEVLSPAPVGTGEGIANHTFKLDKTLDHVPVKQSKFVNNETMSEKLTLNTNTTAKSVEKSNNVMNVSSVKNMEPRSDCVNKGLNVSSINLAPSSTRILNQTPKCQKSFMTSSKPTDVLLRNLHTSLRMVTEDTEGSVENSLSISKIADYLGKQSTISITDMLQLNNQSKQLNRKQPLTELHLNLLENKKTNQDKGVTLLKDSKKAETASSSGTVNTVISVDKLNIADENAQPVVVAQDNTKVHSITRSKSPSSKSQTTLSTVQEKVSSFRSSCTHSSRGETHMNHIPSPNACYRELDKSVDWLEVLQQKNMKEDCLAKEKWADILTSPIEGFVGVSCTATITISTHTESWLTAKLEFDDLKNVGQNLAIELPRFPLLLSPGKTEEFIIHLTSNKEVATKLPFTVYFKDASIDGEIEQNGHLEINIKMPTIQAISRDGVNKISFPIIQEQCTVTKYFVLISDCPVDLKLELAVAEGDSMFIIHNVQEIRRSDVSKALMDRQCTGEDQQTNKLKGKGVNKQLCRLTNDNAIKVTITFNSPKLSDLDISDKMATFNGKLNVKLLGVDIVLKSVSIMGTVGVAHLVVNAPSKKLQLSNEALSVTLTNTGSMIGSWVVKYKNSASTENSPFKVVPSTFDIQPGCTTKLIMMYAGPDDVINEGMVILEEVTTGNVTSIEVSGGSNKPRGFPIKTNYSNMTWVCAGRKEISLKNSSNRKVQIRCQIVGEGFSIDSPGAESRGVCSLAFGPCECRPLPIVFAPPTAKPHVAALHLVYDRNSDLSRKVVLHGCAEGAVGGAGGAGGGLRWSGLMTYGATALVRAQYRAPIDLALYNKSAARSFLAASVHFNLQYACAAGSARLEGARRVVGGRARAALSLRVEWPRVEQRARAPRAAAALATITVLAGPEYTRRRILRILRSESPTGELDTSLLPEHLKVLTEQFEGEDPNMDKDLENFRETKASLNELIESLQELTAQIDLPQEFAEDNTILISDDTVVEHHTLCD